LAVAWVVANATANADHARGLLVLLFAWKAAQALPPRAQAPASLPPSPGTEQEARAAEAGDRR
jgi:hypothetical protein